VTTVVPPTRDRLAGGYYTCGGCSRSNDWGPDCSGHPLAAKSLRLREKRALRQHVADVLGAEPHNPLLDPSDCEHGCSGGRYGCSERCTFICHESEGEDA